MAVAGIDVLVIVDRVTVTGKNSKVEKEIVTVPGHDLYVKAVGGAVSGLRSAADMVVGASGHDFLIKVVLMDMLVVRKLIAGVALAGDVLKGTIC